MTFLEFLHEDQLIDVKATEKCCDESISRRKDRILNLIKDDVVFSTASIRYLKWLSEDYHHSIFESEQTTQPTIRLSQMIAAQFGLEFNVKVFFTSGLFERGIYKSFNANELQLFDNNTQKIEVLTKEQLENQGNSILIKNNCTNVEDNIAGTITYIITINNDVCHKNMLSHKFVNKLQKLALDLGYDYITDSRDELDAYSIFYLRFEANYQRTKFKISEKLYHISPKSNREDILTYGLFPKSESFINSIKINHSNRVYLFNGYNEQAMTLFMRTCNKMTNKQLSGMYIFKDLIDIAFDIYEVNYKTINDLELYRDNMFDSNIKDMPTALYTYDKIPVKSIKLITTINI